VAGVEDGAIAPRHQRKLSYLGVDELTEAGEELNRLGRESARRNPAGEPLLELPEVGVEITRELQ